MASLAYRAKCIAEHVFRKNKKIKQKPTLFVVSGPSGSGKTTIMRGLLSNELLSFTTRPKRQGEVDGVDYEFITQEHFNNLYDIGYLVEHTTYIGNGFSYGLTEKELLHKTSKGDAFFVCDAVGAKQIEEVWLERYSEDMKLAKIFLYDDKVSLSYNMKHRGDNHDTIDSRLDTYDHEVKTMVGYDYVVKNKRYQLDKTIKIIRKIIEIEGSGTNVR